MTNYFKYLPVSDEDINWGLHVLNAGYNRIQHNVNYPAPGHPDDHYFNWDNGRVLNEYQIVYISRGRGIFESEGCQEAGIEEGTVILLFPGEWHRFKPDAETGWDEFWVGFKGDIMENIVKKHFLTPKQCILQMGVDHQIIHLFMEIIAHTKNEQPGYQPLISGIVLHLLGEIYTRTRQDALKQKDISEMLIEKARVILRTNVNTNIPIENVAEELQVSYSWFRKAFKTFTGMAPHQYLLQLKIEKARLLLTGTTKPIKEIAFELGFESSFYFSRIFKVKMGESPDSYRKTKQPQF
jgi:AraC-like DNA-binding protein